MDIGLALLLAALGAGLLLERRHRRRIEGSLEESEERIAYQSQRLAHLTRVAILGELSGALAHELNQPLTSILSNAQAAQHLLSEGSMDLPEVRAILADIVKEDKRAGEVIRNLRAMFRNGELQIQQLHLAQVVRDVLALAHSDLVVKQVAVDIRMAPELPPVPGDRVQIQQVLLNLILNATEAMSLNHRSDRRIRISVQTESHALHVAVADRGSGIAEDQLESIFDAFHTTKSSGLGIGLAICRRIIGAHGGRLWATNNAGRGSTFHFTLPLLMPQ